MRIGAFWLVAGLFLFVLVLTGCGTTEPTSSDTLIFTEEPERTPPELAVTDASSLASLQAQGIDEVTLTVSATPNAQKMNGLGVEWDPHTGMEYNVVWFGENTDDEWALFECRLRELGVQKVRMMILPGWYEPENDNGDPNTVNWEAFTFDSVAFRSVTRQLDLLEKLGIHANLTIWGVDHANTEWLAYPSCTDCWLTAPNDTAEYAENVSVLLDYLLNTRKYTCIKELTVHNEPDWAFKDGESQVDFSYYVKTCQDLHDRLVRDGLRDRILYILSDDTFNHTWLESSVQALNEIADGYNSHNYLYDDTTPYTTMADWAERGNEIVEVFGSGKPYTHNEFGTNGGIGSNRSRDIHTYERGLFYSRFAAACLNAGSAGMLHWEFFDQYYNNTIRSGMMQLGMFQFADRSWKVRPVYHAWGLMMRYTRRDSLVYPVSGNTSAITGTALKAPGGEWSYIATNAGTNPCLVRVENPEITEEFQVYFYTPETAVLTDDRLIGSSGTAYKEDNAVYVLLEPNTFAVLSSLTD